MSTTTSRASYGSRPGATSGTSGTGPSSCTTSNSVRCGAIARSSTAASGPSSDTTTSNVPSPSWSGKTVTTISSARSGSASTTARRRRTASGVAASRWPRTRRAWVAASIASP
ncbi:hypothetical protein IU11_05635 [Cellulosimicrobium sp. MM]|nr:hypothetical protein IU11_05635 [Cellulosimicrobium sp. MM]